MAVIKRRDAKGKIRYAVKVYRPGGKQEWHGTYATLGGAREVERAALSKPRSARNETCDSFAGRWTGDYPRPRASTNKHNAQQVKAFSRDFAGVRLADVDRPAARAWALKHPGNLGAVRAMFTDALNDGLCAQNPFTNLRIKKSSGRKDLEVLTAAELDALLAAARATHGAYGTEYAAMIEFAAYTCMRPGEITVLRWEDVDLDRGEVHVRRTLSGDKWIELPKNNQVRTIVLPPAARKALAAVPRRLGSDRVFSTVTGRRFSKGTWHYAWNPVRSAFGRPTMDFYELRHFGCTYMLDALGLSAADAAVQLGHTDGGRLVMELYGHPSEAAARERIRHAFGDRVVHLQAASG